MATAGTLCAALKGVDQNTPVIITTERKLVCGSIEIPIHVQPTLFEEKQVQFVEHVLKSIDLDVKHIPRFDEFLATYADPIALYRCVHDPDNLIYGNPKEREGFVTALVRHILQDPKTCVSCTVDEELDVLDAVLKLKPDLGKLQSLRELLDADGFTQEAIATLGFTMVMWQEVKFETKLEHGKFMGDVISTLSQRRCFIDYRDASILKELAPYLKDPKKLPPLYTLSRCLNDVARGIKINIDAVNTSIVCYFEDILKHDAKEIEAHLENPTTQTRQYLESQLRRWIPGCYYFKK